MPNSAPTGAPAGALLEEWRGGRRTRASGHGREAHPEQGPGRPAQIREGDLDVVLIVLRIERAALRIQKTMERRMTTAAAPTSASKSSCVRCGNWEPTASTAAPAKSDSATARSTPIHTVGSQSDRPVRARYPAMIPTISAASNALAQHDEKQQHPVHPFDARNGLVDRSARDFLSLPEARRKRG